jgi:putative oxidoreductase
MFMLCFLKMEEIIKHLLFSDLGSELNNLAVFIFRVLLMLELFRVHGLKKFRLQNGEKEQVPNPLGLPEKVNSLLATFSDTIVPVFVALGLGTRLFLLPSIGVTAIGYFAVHRNDSVEVRDVPYMYTLAMVFLWVIGSGSYSMDHYIFPIIFN